MQLRNEFGINLGVGEGIIIWRDSWRVNVRRSEISPLSCQKSAKIH
ncbi:MULTISPECIES: hypothetical protein [Okeania]|nr:MULTISPECIES: hypothetical protein [Okeania]NET74932.1 hypothetical protein [Okeania sp. SIO1F9]